MHICALFLWNTKKVLRMKQVISLNIREKLEALEVLNYQIRSCEMCSQYLEDELAIIQPEVIVPLGQYAARAILKQSSVEFGRLQIVDGQKVYPLPHPASLLYNPSYESNTIEKYKKLKTFL